MLREKINQVGLFIALMAISITGSTQNKVVVVPLGSSGSADILYGRAPSSADEALLFEWPGAGVEVRTRDVDAGDSVFEVRIINTNPPGGPSFRVANVGTGSSNLASGASIERGGLAGAVSC